MFLTGDLEDGVMLDVLDHIGIPQGTYFERFVKIWPYLALKLNVTLEGGGQRPETVLWDKTTI